MKPKAWQLTCLVFSVWLAAVQSADAGGWAGTSASDFSDVTQLSGGGLSSLRHSFSCAASDAPRDQLSAKAFLPGRPHFCGSAELPADDSDLTDDSQSGSDDLVLPGVELSPHAAEWRLTCPDTHRANSFINSKTKPPP